MSRFILSLILIVLLCGCRDPKASESVSWEQEPTDYTLTIMIDVDLIKTNPRAYEFVIYALDHYFRDRVGTDDQVILAQLSGKKKPVMFQGTPRALREEIPSEEQFKNFIAARSEEGRRINEGVVETLKYVSRTSSVKRGGAVPVVLIVSSMIDGQPESKESEDRVVESLIKFGLSGGKMAYYFVDQDRMDVIQERMEKAGFSFTILECDVYGRPPLPTFNR